MPDGTGVCHRPLVLATLVLMVSLLPARGGAQQRPLVTEDPEPVGSGLVLLEVGVDYLRDQPFPVSGLEGHLVRVPTLGISIGVSSIAEVQIDGLSYSRLQITERTADAPLASLVTARGSRSSDMDDLVIGAKVRMLSETDRRPAIALRFATRLPNAGNESGLGLDTFDFFNTVLVAKTISSVRVVGNVGLGILGDPVTGHRQNDLVVYGFSLARAVGGGAEVVAEVNGRVNTRRGTPPPGTDSSGYVRAGARYTVGTVRVDGGVASGLTPRDAGLGVTVGVTWVFTGLEVP